MPAMPTTCVLLLFSLGVTALLPRPLSASPFRRPAEGSSLAGLGGPGGPGGPGGAGLIDDRLQQRVEAVLTQELSREERALVGRLLAELAAGGAGLGGALPPLGWGPGSSSSSDEEGGEEGEGAGGDGGRGERALSARVRKAGCKNFFWKTFTSC